MPTTAVPGANSRGRGGKFKKYTRGGGRHFSRDLQPADEDGNKISMWSAKARNKQMADSDEGDSEEDSEEESSEDENAPAGEASREDRKAQKKARKEAAIAKSKAKTVEVGDLPSSDEEDSDDDMPVNPNHSKSARSQINRAVEEVTEGVQNLKAPGNRKEREAMEAQAARERYLKLQAEGKTDQAKADMARLRLIREQREAEASRRQAEKEEKDAQDKARRDEIEAREAKLRAAAAAAPKKGKKK